LANVSFDQNPRVRPQQLGPGRPGPLDAGDQLVQEAPDPARGVRRALAQADVQDLAGVGAGSQQRVIAAPAGIAERGALLGAPVDLADEAVDIDDKPPAAGARPCPPGARERLAEQPVELADMPEAERAQNVPIVDGAATLPSSADKRPERRTSQSSMQSAPKTIANSRLITLRPTLAAPTRSPRRTNRPASASIPSRAASVATSTIPASDTARRSSKTTCTRSSPSGPSSCTMKVTS
jgi:hypothetical protein